jgi:hypothetical protein
MKTNIKASHLTGIKDAEASLARRETDVVLNDLPPGHPLRVAAEMEQQQSGDIADLPESHPLKVALREARERVVASQTEETKKQEQFKLIKAKRLEASKEFRAKVDAEEQAREIKRDAYRAINEKIDRAVEGVDGLLTAINATTQDVFGDDRFSMVKMARLQRLMFAARRGLTDSRLRAGA